MNNYLSLVILLLFSTGSTADNHPLNITVYADSNYYPYSYEESGSPRGIYYDIVSHAFSSMPKYNLTVKAVPWKRGLRNLENGLGVAIYPPYKLKSTRPYIDPYSVPLLNEDVVIYCRSDAGELVRSSKWPNDFYGLKIGINRGFILDRKLQTSVASGKISLFEAENSNDNIKMMLMGRIECHVNSHVSILSEIKTIKSNRSLSKILKENPISHILTLSTKEGYLGFYKDEENKYPFKADLIDAFNRAITKMKDNGVIEEIVAGY